RVLDRDVNAPGEDLRRRRRGETEGEHQRRCPEAEPLSVHVLRSSLRGCLRKTSVNLQTPLQDDIIALSNTVRFRSVCDFGQEALAELGVSWQDRRKLPSPVRG